MTEPTKPSVTGTKLPNAETPASKPAEKPTQLPAPTKAEKMKELSEKLGKLLQAAGGKESNIPVTHSEYWSVKAELDAVRNTPE